MSYTGSELAEYPVPIEDGLANDDSGSMVFLCAEEDVGVIPPPTPANSHIETWCANTQYDSPIHVQKRRLANSSPVDAAFRSGYIILLPGEAGFSEQDGMDTGSYTIPKVTSAFKTENYLMLENKPEVTGLEYPTYEINLRWAVEVPEGYSILVTNPFFMTNDKYSIIPSVHDADDSRTWIQATVQIHEIGFKINCGRPIAQIIPFKRDDSRLPVVIDRTSPSDNAE